MPRRITKLQAVDRRIADAQHHLARQRAVLASADLAPHLSCEAEALLAEMEALLDAEEKHKAWILQSGHADDPAAS